MIYNNIWYHEQTDCKHTHIVVANFLNQKLYRQHFDETSCFDIIQTLLVFVLSKTIQHRNTIFNFISSSTSHHFLKLINIVIITFVCFIVVSLKSCAFALRAVFHRAAASVNVSVPPHRGRSLSKQFPVSEGISILL